MRTHIHDDGNQDSDHDDDVDEDDDGEDCCDGGASVCVSMCIVAGTWCPSCPWRLWCPLCASCLWLSAGSLFAIAESLHNNTTICLTQQATRVLQFAASTMKLLRFIVLRHEAKPQTLKHSSDRPMTTQSCCSVSCGVFGAVGVLGDSCILTKRLRA